jgi:hypothetical protein
MFEQFIRTIDELNRFTEQIPNDLSNWLEEVHIDFMIARALADVMAWLKDAKGPNAEAMRQHCRAAHQRVLLNLRNSAQHAFMLWGVNISTPKGLKIEE